MFDIATIFVGTLIVTVIAMLIAGPIGILSAIYLSEYASPRTRGTVKPILEILAGIPSVVLGFFALTFINPTIVQTLVPDRQGLQPRGRRRSPSASSRSRSSRRSPRTR